MSSPIELIVCTEGSVSHAVPLGARPIHIGRAPHNDLVLIHDQISWHHATAWVEGGNVWVRDLESSNGTFIDERQLRGADILPNNGTLSLGGAITLRIAGENTLSNLPRAWLVQDVTSGVSVAARSDRFVIGSGEGCDLTLDHAADRAATLIFHANGEVWIGTDDGEFSAEPGQEFEVAGRRLRLVSADPRQSPTAEVDPDRYPYRLSATLNGAAGPEATLDDHSTGSHVLVDAGNRAVLLYLLGQKLLADRATGVSAEDAGWCSDSDVRVGIWGKKEDFDANLLHVLVYRLRKDLKKAGLDPWFIEKRRGAIRARLAVVEIS